MWVVPAHVGQLLGSRNWLTSRRLTRLYMITTRYATSGILWPGMFWWAWRDSNSHVRRRQFLRLVRMRFRHRPMALRGRFEQPIVGLEATCVTIRIRSTLVGRALTHLPDVKELTRMYSLAEGTAHYDRLKPVPPTNTIKMRVGNWTGRSNRGSEFLLRCP